MGDEKSYLSCPEVERGEGRDDRLESGKTQWTRRGNGDAPRGQRDSNRGDRVAGRKIGNPAWIPERSRAKGTNGRREKKLGLNKERQSLKERRARVERKCRCASARGGPTTLAWPGERERSVQRRCAATAALAAAVLRSVKAPPCARTTGCDLWRPGCRPEETEGMRGHGPIKRAAAALRLQSLDWGLGFLGGRGTGREKKAEWQAG